MPSSQFADLTIALALLRKHLLPVEFEATGSYPDEVLTRALAYRVLAHAEIEAYIEERVIEVARSAIVAFKTDGRPSSTLMALIAFSGRMMEEPPATMLPSQPSQAKTWDEVLYLLSKVTTSLNLFDSAVRSNHGVKEANLLRMLLPVGVDPDTLDPTWLAGMNAFGEKRGLAAHTAGASVKTKQPPDPRSELEGIEAILQKLEKLDSQLDSLMPQPVPSAGPASQGGGSSEGAVV